MQDETILNLESELISEKIKLKEAYNILEYIYKHGLVKKHGGKGLLHQRIKFALKEFPSVNNKK